MTKPSPFPLPSTISSGMIVAAALALLVAMLWLPFGFNVGFTGDDWIYFHQAASGSIMSQAAPTRLFIPIPWLIAYALNPGHFAGINLFIALMIFGKGLLVYGILRRLNSVPVFAFASAALAVLLPADTGIFYMGGLHNQAALCCYLLALYLLLVYWRKPRVSVLLGMWMAQLGSVGISEQVYPLMIFSPLILLLLRAQWNRRLIRVTVLWSLVPLINACFYAWIILSFPRAFAYQGSLIQAPNVWSMLESVGNIYLRHFVTGWVPTGAAPSLPILLISVGAGLVIGAVCLWLGRREAWQNSRRSTLVLALGGLAIIALAVVLYLPTSLRDETLRTYYFSSVGAGLTVAAFISWLAKRPAIFAILIGCFGALGMLSLLGQHSQYFDESEQQQRGLTALVAALPDPAAGIGIIVVDETPDQAYSKLMHGPLYAEDVLPLLYGDPSLEGALCFPDDFGPRDNNRCRFNAEGVSIPSVRTRVFQRTYSRLIVIRYDGNFSVVNDLSPYTGSAVADYQPALLYDPAAPLPQQMAELFAP